MLSMPHGIRPADRAATALEEATLHAKPQHAMRFAPPLSCPLLAFADGHLLTLAVRTQVPA
jgi:hypothetical protein